MLFSVKIKVFIVWYYGFVFEIFGGEVYDWGVGVVLIILGVF